MVPSERCTASAIHGARLLGPLFDDTYSDAGMVLWIAPGVVGGVAIGMLSRHYRRRLCAPVP